MFYADRNSWWARSGKERPTSRTISRELEPSVTMVVELEEPDQPLAFSAGLRCSRFEVETALDERLALVEVPVSKAAVVLCYRLLCPEADGDLCLLVRICKCYEFYLLKRDNPLPSSSLPVPVTLFFLLWNLNLILHFIVRAVLRLFVLILNIKYRSVDQVLRRRVLTEKRSHNFFFL